MTRKTLGLFAVCSAIFFASVARGGIPSVEERVLNSSLNPEYRETWRSGMLRLSEKKDLAEDAVELVVCYRKDFELSAPPRIAQFCLHFEGVPYWLKINGETVLAPQDNRQQLGWMVALDITRYLRAGRNVITFSQPLRVRAAYWAHSWLVTEGIVFGEDGDTVRILSDNWRGAWDMPAGWDDPENVPENMPILRAGNPVRGRPDSTVMRPYYGPIQVAALDPAGGVMGQPIFDDDASVSLDILLMNARRENETMPELKLEVMDLSSRRIIESREVALAAKDRFDLVGQVRGEPLPQGAYRYRFVLNRDGEEVDRHDFELASVGVIPQRLVQGTHYEDGLELEQVWSVDCTQEPLNEQDFVASHTIWGQTPAEGVKTEVVEGPAGKYRALTDNSRMHQFAYRYHGLRNLWTPHLAVVEWPDDAPREFIAHVVETASGFPEHRSFRHLLNFGYQRSEAAVVARQDLHPERSNKMQKLHMLFWPNSDEGSIHLANVGGGAPAAAARITIYEITNDLPALQVADAGDRMIGYMTERGPTTMAWTYYAGPLGAYFQHRLVVEGRGVTRHAEFYRNWMTTTENLIKRMRFSGQNTYYMGHLMYRNLLIPSDQGIFGGGNTSMEIDYNPLTLRMFEHNDMYMVSGIEIAGLPGFRGILGGAAAITPEDIKAGKVSPLLSVSREGTLFPFHSPRLSSAGSGGGDAVLNYFHPQIQQAVIDTIGEFADRYGTYKSWRGVAFFISRCFGPMDTALLNNPETMMSGYEDWTIERFEQDTGLVIPVAKDDPLRFRKRYDWLTDKGRQAWIDWRCRQYTELWRRIRDRMQAASSEAELYIVLGEPMLWRRASNLMAGSYDDVAERGREILREFGFDVEAIKHEPGISVSFTHPVAGSGDGLGAVGGWRSLERNQEWQSLFANDGHGGAFLKGNIPHYGAYSFPADRWVFSRNRTRQGYFWSTYVTESFVNVMARANPAWMPHTWMDVTESMGRIHELRLFARAYRTLPNGEYERLTGNGLDKNIWISGTHVRDSDYIYAANLHWWETDVTLQFAPGIKVHDLISDMPVELRDGAWNFKLAPYSIQTFRVTGARQGLRGAAALPLLDEDEKESVEGAIQNSIERAETLGEAVVAREDELSFTPGWDALPSLQAGGKKVRQSFEKGDLAGAFSDIVPGGRLDMDAGYITDFSLQAMPMLILGPFGDPADTDIKRWGRGNPEVVPGFRGMETAYIGESDHPDCLELRPGFRPDITRSYRVYPGRDLRWQVMLLTDELNFGPTANSEHPSWMTSYAFTEIYSPDEREIVMHMGSINAVWIWVNDALVIRYGGADTSRYGQRGMTPGATVGSTRLAPGWNRVLIKALQRGDTSAVSLQITDKEGRMASDLRYRAMPAS